MASTAARSQDPWLTGARAFATGARAFATGALDLAGHATAAAYPDPEVRRVWAARTDQPADLIISRLRAEVEPDILLRLTARIAHHPVPDDVLTRLARHPDRSIAVVAPLHRDCPDEVAAATLQRLRRQHRFWLERVLLDWVSADGVFRDDQIWSRLYRSLEGRPAVQAELVSHLDPWIAVAVLPVATDPRVQDLAVRRLLSLNPAAEDAKSLMSAARKAPWTAENAARLLAAIDRRYPAESIAHIRTAWLAGGVGDLRSRAAEVLRIAASGALDEASDHLAQVRQALFDLAEPNPHDRDAVSEIAWTLARGPWQVSEQAAARLLRTFSTTIPRLLDVLRNRVTLSDSTRVETSVALLAGPVIGEQREKALSYLVDGRVDLFAAIVEKSGVVSGTPAHTILVRATLRGARADKVREQLWETGLVAARDLLGPNCGVDLALRLPLREVLANERLAPQVVVRVLGRVTAAQAEIASGLASTFAGSADDLVAAARSLAPST